MPESRFSFFPDPVEAESLRTATIEELVEIFQGQTDMAARFMHELIAIGRVEELKAALKPLSNSKGVTSGIVNDLAVSTGMMRSMFDVPEKDAKEFVDKAVAILNEVFPGNLPSPANFHGEIEEENAGSAFESMRDTKEI